MMKKKIIISNFDDISNPYYGGGGAIGVHEVAKRLVNSYDVIVITGRYPGSKDEMVDGVNYKRIGIAKIDPRVGQMIYQFILWTYVIRLKYDLWIESFTPPFSTSFISMFTKKPVIGWVHMLASEDMERKYKLPIFHIIESFGIKRYTNIAGITPEVVAKLQKINPNCNVSFIPNGIDAEFVKYADNVRHNKPNKSHILFIGRLEVNQKGLDLLIEAYKMIAQKVSVPLVIAGGGAKYDEDELKKIIRQNNLEDRIKLVGRVSGITKYKLFEESYCQIVPSRFETFGVVAVEGMYLERPVITFDIDGFRWIPDDAVYKISKFDTDKLSEVMLNIVQSTLDTRNRIVKGYEFSKDLTWEHTYKKFDSLIGQKLK